MAFQRLDLSIWHLLYSNSFGQSETGRIAFAPLNSLSDKAIFTVVHDSNDFWVRGGWIGQVGHFDNDDILVTRSWINLNESKILDLEPIASSTLVFEPVSWLYDYQVTIKFRLWIE